MNEESSTLMPLVEEQTNVETDSSEAAPNFVCDCEEGMRSACNGEPFYKEYGSKRYCVLHYPGKEKVAVFQIAFQRKLDNNDFDFRGVWFPDEVNFNSFEFRRDANFIAAIFCAKANFGFTRFSKYANFGAATFKADVSFGHTIFSGNANFVSSTFSGNANFVSATFKADAGFVSARYSMNADFDGVTFRSNANFRSAIFSADANFVYAKFNGKASFASAIFNGDADFNFAKFSTDTDFSVATFDNEGYFNRAVLNSTLSFFGHTCERLLEDGTRIKERALGKNPLLDFQHARIEKPDRVSFHTVSLRPHWFVNVDSRKFVFTDVSWEWDNISIESEIESLTKKRVPSPHRLLAIACRQLAENAEANNRYEEASKFRYWAMDLARHYKWASWRFWRTDWLHMVYWLVSGYGEKILRALLCLMAVLIVFALLYTQVGFTTPAPKPTDENPAATTEDTTGQPLKLQRAFTYSLAVMSLQRPEPRPLTNWAHALVTLEMILGPVQAALLVLAIRRKFMR